MGCSIDGGLRVGSLAPLVYWPFDSLAAALAGPGTQTPFARGSIRRRLGSWLGPRRLTPGRARRAFARFASLVARREHVGWRDHAWPQAVVPRGMVPADV